MLRLAVAVPLLAYAVRAPAAEPLCDWMDGLGLAAQARLDGRIEEAHRSARRALAARPSGDAAARANLALGLALDGSGSAEERIRALRSAATVAPPVERGAILAALGEALLARGDAREAADSFRTAAAEGASAVSTRAQWRAADALHAAGLPAEAVAAWHSLATDRLASGFDPPARLAFAIDLRAAGDPLRAAAILHAVWATLPERAEARTAEGLLEEWRAEDPRVPPVTGEERLDRALRLVSLGLAPDALAEIEKATAGLPPAPAGPASLAKATALLALGRPAEAALEVEPLARSQDAGVRRGVQLVRARVATRQRRVAEAIAAWRAVAASRAKVPGLGPASQAGLRDEAEYFAAWLQFDAGDLGRAAAELGRIARKRPRSRRAEDARWFAAWALVRMNEPERADAALRAIEDGPSAPRVRYWRARIAPDGEVAEGLLRSVVELDPRGYYGILACERLRAKGVPCEPPSLGDGPTMPELDPLPSAARIRQAAALASAGLRADALAELEAIVGTHGNRRAAPIVAELAAFLGDSLLPFRLSRDQIGLSRRTLEWSFPSPWSSLIAGSSKAAGVDPSLVRAVMRRESGFRSDVRSAAGAVGLLQIVPATAARIGSLLSVPPGFEGQMADPAVNVPLGVSYLALLLERFRDPLVAVAAYNAGPGAISRWCADRKDLPLDAWVESIPFRETRHYVRAVVANWAGTRAADRQPAPAIDPDRPVPAPPPGVMF